MKNLLSETNNTINYLKKILNSKKIKNLELKINLTNTLSEKELNIISENLFSYSEPKINSKVLQNFINELKKKTKNKYEKKNICNELKKTLLFNQELKPDINTINNQDLFCSLFIKEDNQYLLTIKFDTDIKVYIIIKIFDDHLEMDTLLTLKRGYFGITFLFLVILTNLLNLNYIKWTATPKSKIFYRSKLRAYYYENSKNEFYLDSKKIYKDLPKNKIFKNIEKIIYNSLPTELFTLKLNLSNNNIPSNWESRNSNNFGGGNFIFVNFIGKRKIYYIKNGKSFIILNKKKVLIKNNFL